MVYLCSQCSAVPTVGIPQVGGKWAAVDKTPFPPKGGPISKHVGVLERTKIWSWVSTGPETEIDCAAETSSNIPDRSTDCYSIRRFNAKLTKAAAVKLLNKIEPSSYPITLRLYGHFNVITSMPIYLKWYLPFVIRSKILCSFLMCCLHFLSISVICPSYIKIKLQIWRSHVFRILYRRCV